MYTKILVALDGSTHSFAGARVALALAGKCEASLVTAHVYDAGLHSRRLVEMEPFLPARYQEEGALTHIRISHRELIPGGFESLSEGYMERFVEEARRAGVPVEKIRRQGRNYVGILEMIRELGVDLVVLGAHGLGEVGDGFLGSTAVRIMRFAGCDVFLARHEGKRGKVLAGIDGSPEALDALRKAASWATAVEEPLETVAVYDPHFHYQVFNAMATALTPERQEEMGFTNQKALHEELIDTALGRLYQGFLNQAGAACREGGIEAEPVLLKGKAYRELLDYGERAGASLIVLGRYGHHRGKVADMGSNSEAVARLAKTNVLVVGPKGPLSDAVAAMEWENPALERLDRIPSFARAMARQGIESHVRSKGKDRVTLEDFEEVSKQLGMGRSRTSHDE